MQPPTLQKEHFPAPSGGVNSVDPASEIPPTDCVYAYNLVRAQLGLRTRSGYREWAINLTGGTDNSVRTVIPYNGAAQNQTKDKLFAATSTGIWDITQQTTTAWAGTTTYAVGQTVSNSGNIYICTIGGVSAGAGGPSGTNSSIVDNTVTWSYVGSAGGQVVVFATPTGNAGYGVFHAFSNPGGHYLVYCDEVNGLFLYTESTGLWTQGAAGVAALWQTNIAISVGTQVQVNGNVYIATVAGVTSATPAGAPTGTGNGQVDNTVTWNYVSAKVASVIGPSVADQNNGLTITPAQFVSVTVFKSRIWFTEAGATRGWYLGANAIFGEATSFDFGVKARVGGPLVGLFNWSYDGGSGLDTLLVAISSSGDVIIYQGTDPTSAATFGLVGTWSVGGVPYGRRIAVEYGGDVLITSMLGLIPLSKLCTGVPVDDKSIYDTYKVSNLFNQLAVTYQTQLGWAIIIHPTDNCILVNIPQPLGWAQLQFAMAFSSKSWSFYRNLPIVSASVWNGLLYIGTIDGRVCVCQGAIDNVTLSNPAANQKPVAWSLLTCFKGAEKPTRKIIRQIRPSVLSAVPNPVIQAVAKLDFDTVEPIDTSANSVGGPGTWDHGVWDVSKWGSDFSPAIPTIGAYGVAQLAVGIALRGQAISSTTIVGADLFYEDASAV
jgi:hypothetical protein